MWNSLKDIPTAVITAGAGLIAACVALVSLVINRSLTIRFQRDTQFYEALKRFGDQDSPMLRSSAAGLLGQMGRQTSLLTRRKPYLKTATDQLLMGLLMEREMPVLMSIANATATLSRRGRSLITDRLRDVSNSIRFDLEEAIIEWALINEISDLTGFSESHIEGLGDISAKASTLVREWLANLEKAEDAQRGEIADSFAARFRLMRARSELLRTADRQSITQNLARASLRHELATKLLVAVLSSSAGGPMARLVSGICDWLIIFHRWRLLRLVQSIPLPQLYLISWWLADADLSYSPLRNLNFIDSTIHGANFSGSVLVNVDLTNANLSDAKFRYTQLTHVDFTLADLRGADFGGCRIFKDVKFCYAKIDDRTNFRDCNWWSANFYTKQPLYESSSGPVFLKSEWLVIDNELLHLIFKRYSSELPAIKDAKEIHGSVRSYMKKRGLWRFKTN